jgi:UDP-N-acetylmuramoyl-L-alanyl-D-glutamate--2,6-diaminopimelate ligase
VTAPREVRLSDLLDAARIRPLAEVGADPLIRGASLDSRRTRPGDLFFAIRGFTADGETFVHDAILRGARAVVAESPRPATIPDGIGWVQVAEARRAAGTLSRECYGRPDEALALVGITGTNGKTTVAHLVESIGRAAGRHVGRIGTVGGAFEGRHVPQARTTPEAPDFYRLLAEMRDCSVDLVAMEVSSHALALARVEGARFEVAAFLNISPDHLDFHGDEETYFAAKCRLFESLDAKSRAVLPADAPEGERIRRRTSAGTLTFGRGAGADVRLTEERCTLDGSSAILRTPLGVLPIRTFLLGRKNLDNAAAAAACAVALDLPAQSIPAGVLALERVPGRLEKIERGQPFHVLVDYAHTPAALEALLAWVREAARGRVLAVFGCGGARDRGKRPQMGRLAAALADRIWLTSDNPRHEDPDEILRQIERGVAQVAGGPERCTKIEERGAAIRAAIRDARPGDVVVVAGKGHETTQVVGDRTRPFDDREESALALAELGHVEGRRAGA